MRQIRELAGLYFTQCRRQHIFVVPLLTGVFLAMVPHFITAFSLSAFDRVSRDACMTLMSVLMVALALILGGTAVPLDVERRSLYPVLARPISRFQYLMGKMAGVAMVLGVSLTLCGVGALVGVTSLTGHFEGGLLAGAACYWLEGCVLAASCLLISTVATAPVAVAGGLLTYIVGGVSNAYVSLFLVGEHSSWIQSGLVIALRAVVPHFDVFHVKDAIVHDEDVAASYFTSLALYGVMWVILQLNLAAVLFARRDV